MSDVACEMLEISQWDAEMSVPSDLLPRGTEESQNGLSEASTYTMASDQSQMSRDVDLWLRGSTESTGTQGTRSPPALRTTAADVPSFYNNGVWYILALILPFFSANNYPHWRCSPSTILNSAEFLAVQLGRVCDRVRCNIRRLARNQMSREMLATAMDIILFVYAIGFLVLSMYQASIIG